jgi:hypothetical protein
VPKPGLVRPAQGGFLKGAITRHTFARRSASFVRPICVEVLALALLGAGSGSSQASNCNLRKSPPTFEAVGAWVEAQGLRGALAAHQSEYLGLGSAELATIQQKIWNGADQSDHYFMLSVQNPHDVIIGVSAENPRKRSRWSTSDSESAFWLTTGAGKVRASVVVPDAKADRARVLRDYPFLHEVALWKRAYCIHATD